jgi:hypothetical protein
MSPVKIAHIVHPLSVPPSSDLYVAQPVTFASMRVARELAAGHGIEVAHFSAQFPDGHTMVPPEFIVTPDLDRSMLDFGTFQVPRRLPLIKDILDRLYAASAAEFFIYTNVDITLMPFFYRAVAELITQGYDAFVINRRTIPATYQQPDQLPLMYAEIGQPHPGHDCFVFPRAAYPAYQLGRVCLGTLWVGKVMLWNMACHAEKFAEFTDLHLTFHLGNQEVWKQERYADEAAFNRHEAAQVADQLEHAYGPFDARSFIPPYFMQSALTTRRHKITVKGILRRMRSLLRG